MNRKKIVQGSRKLTYSSLFYLLCRNSEDIQYFDHYLHDDVCHRRGWWNFGIGLEAFEEVLDALKDVYQCLSGCTNVLCRLRSAGSSSVARRRRERYRPGEGRLHLRR